MGCMRPATPGFLVTLVATILLAVVSFSVPWFKSVFFLKASLSVEGINGDITFGTLGYCVELGNGTTCSKPSIGYELNINALVGNNTPIQIPQVLVKWLTYALVLHIVALVLAAGSSVFGLLAHVREFSMSCFSTCISGMGAAITLLAFIFDLAFFFIAKSRINNVPGGSATMGNAIWLTLAAWILLFTSGCFYGLGRCCNNSRRRPRDEVPKNSSGWPPPQPTGPTYEEQMRLDAVRAEADRKARQKQGELGLPAFPEYDPTMPLTAEDEQDHQPSVPYRDTRTPAAGYAPAPPGTAAADAYYRNEYPPQPRRQATASSGHTQQTTANYASSTYGGAVAISTGPSVPAAARSGFLQPGQHQQYPTQASGPYGGHEQYATQASYGGGYAQPTTTSYNEPSAQQHQQYPTQASYADPFQNYSSPTQQPPAHLNPDTYNQTGVMLTPPRTYTSPAPVNPPQRYTSPHEDPYSAYEDPYYNTAAPSNIPPQPAARTYTLAGGGYGENTVPVIPEEHERISSSASYLPYPGGESYTPESALSAGMQPQAAQNPEEYEEAPPGYEPGPGRYAASSTSNEKR